MNQKPLFTLMFFILFLPQKYTLAQTTSKAAGTINGITDLLSGFVDQNLQQYQQQNQQYLQMIQQQQLMSQMTPQVAQPSTTFPNCPLPALNSPPEGMCSNIQGPDAFLMAQNVKAAALRYSSSFDPYLSSAQTGVGVSCIDMAIKNLVQYLSGKSNHLQQMIDQTIKEQLAFSEGANALKKQMEGISNELYGGGGDVDEKSKDYTHFFPGCRGIIPSDALTNPKGGLVGIRNSMENNGMRSKANDLLINQAIYAKEIEELTERIKADVKEIGIDKFFTEQGPTPSKWFRGGITNFGGVQQIIFEASKEVNLKRERIAQDLKAVGYTPPPMDQNFRKKMGEFAGGATVYFQKKFINDCIMGGNKEIKKLGIKQDELVNNIQHKNLGRSGAAVSEYRNRLETILNGPGFIDEKLTQIKDLDKIYGKNSFLIYYKNSSGNFAKDTPENYFNSMMKVCEGAYESGGALAKDDPSGSSYKEKVENAQRGLNELKQLEETFTGSLGNLLKDKLLTCSNAPLKEGQCTPESMTVASPDFCLKRASFCAERTRSCFTHADRLVKERTAKMKALAGNYNQKVVGFINYQEAQLAQIKAAVNNDINILKQTFPGAIFTVPPLSIIELPPLMDTQLGVQLRGGGELDPMAGLPEQLNKIKRAMENQGKLAIREGQQYRENQKQQMRESKDVWQEMAKQCDSAMEEFTKSYSENMGKMMEEEEKLGTEVGEFCFKYERLTKTNPMAGCDGDNSPAKLYDDAFKVASFLDPSVIENLGEYEKLCAQSQNQPEMGTEKDKRPELIKLCDLTGDDWEKVIEIKKREILQKISDPKVKANAKTMMDSKEPADMDTAKFPISLLNQITNIKRIEGQRGIGRENLIIEANGEGKTKEEVKLEEVKNLISGIKKEMGNEKFNNFKKELDKVEVNLTPKTLENARGELATLLSPGEREKFEKEIGPENLENFKKQMVGLEGISNSISQKAMEDLPELPPSGLGTDHKNLFEKGDDEKNQCLALKNTKVKNAILDCSDKKQNFKRCFDEEIGDTADKLDKTFVHLNDKLNSMSNYEDTEAIAEKWSALGEGGRTACTSQGSQGRGKEPEKQGIGKFQEVIEDLMKVKEK